MSPPERPPVATQPAVQLGTPTDEVLGRRRWWYAATTAALTVIMGLAVVDAVGVADVYGVDSTWVTARGGGYDLRVQHGTVSRPGLATPFDIVVERPGGFDGPVEVAIEQSYLRIWDANGQYPTPSSETTQGEWLVWEFDPPDGDTLTFTLDGRIEPAVQRGRDGAVSVLDDGQPVLQVELTTRVLP